jgi:pSer/pThr/pTyr-binding forkhead associated (FHA) protein/tetratricopeptide (TPR) repeat protein
MTDPEDRSKKGGAGTPDDLELVEDDDIIAADSDDLAEDVSTGKLDVPVHIRKKMKQALPGDEDVLGEDPFEDDTDTGEVQVGPKQAQALLDDQEVFEDEELEEAQTSDLGPSSKNTEEPVGDTMEEPVSPRRRRRRRRPQDLEAEEPAAAESQEAPPWNREEDAAEPEPMYQEVTDSSWTPEAAEVAARPPPPVAPTSVEPVGADPAQEKTLIFGEEAEPGPSEFPFLVVVQGEEEGREIELTQAQVTMGRGADNDLVFPDIACSRRHCILEKRDNDFVVTDLGSGNGTVVNGSRVQSAVLGDGDEIEIGSTILQFNLPAAAGRSRGADVQTVTSTHPMPAEGKPGFLGELLADPRRKKLIIYGGGGVLGFLLLMLLVKAVSGPAEPPPPSPEELRRQEQLRMQQEFDEHMQEARRLVKEKNWKQAQLSIQLALKLDPQNRFALDYRDFVAREVGAQTALQTARSFIEQKAWDQAIAALNQVGRESEGHEEAVGLKKNIELEIKSDLVAQGKALMEEKNYNQALLKFDEVLRRDPDYEEAATLKREVEEEIAKEEKRVATLEKRKRHKTVSFKRRKKRETKKKGGLTGRMLALYKNGEVDKAIEKAEEAGATEQLVKLKKFKSVYTRGMDLSKNKGQMKKAIEFLKQAMTLDKKIAGGAGKYSQEIKEKLGKNYFVKGVDAHMKKRYPEAYKAYKTSLKYHPSYELASKRLQELEKIAKKFYEEAYIIKSTNAEAAIKKLNTVLQIVPPHHVYYSKAKRLKSSIQGPLSSEPTDDSGF